MHRKPHLTYALGHIPETAKNLHRQKNTGSSSPPRCFCGDQKAPLTYTDCRHRHRQSVDSSLIGLTMVLRACHRFGGARHVQASGVCVMHLDRSTQSGNGTLQHSKGLGSGPSSPPGLIGKTGRTADHSRSPCKPKHRKQLFNLGLHHLVTAGPCTKQSG